MGSVLPLAKAPEQTTAPCGATGAPCSDCYRHGAPGPAPATGSGRAKSSSSPLQGAAGSPDGACPRSSTYQRGSLRVPEVPAATPLISWRWHCQRRSQRPAGFCPGRGGSPPPAQRWEQPPAPNLCCIRGRWSRAGGGAGRDHPCHGHGTRLSWTPLQTQHTTVRSALEPSAHGPPLAAGGTRRPVPRLPPPSPGETGRGSPARGGPRAARGRGSPGPPRRRAAAAASIGRGGP